ncbi:MAG: hypothetical protein QOG09_436 [Solirubrobacterales bacterium]|jgi:hypothetical protein|nr:hypothetical protein [Solirubrobacterales bacterium]MDX6662334.1 hypothetical protein [Solirubrobacterales bacterium]
MTDRYDIRRDLDPALEPQERDRLVRFAERLREDRPLPAASFRGELQRRLERRRERSMPVVRLRRMVTAYVSSGSLLLAIGALGVAGAGPFAA